MKWRADGTDMAGGAIAGPMARGRLFRKYVALFVVVVSGALVVNGLFDIWFSYREQTRLLVRVQREQAAAAAARIGQFIKEIEGHIGWATQLPWRTEDLEQWRFEAALVLRQVPAITELAELDASGNELVRVSRLAVDVVGSRKNFSQDPVFVQAMAGGVYYGPVSFRQESEPYLTLAMAGPNRDYGVILAEVNLKFIWDVVSQIKVGQRGLAYVVDQRSRLIAHPDISLVLRNTDLSQLAQVQAARAPPLNAPEESIATDVQGRRVLTAHAAVEPLGWLVFAELPMEEAYASLYASMLRSGALLVAALVMAVLAGLVLARRMIVPIMTLRDGARRIGSGDLAQRISIKTGDELEALGDQFNNMADRLQDSYATLERKVRERTHQLELANLAKSRFLAVASHDLRQPLHALGLFVAQLRYRMNATERKQVIGQIDAAVAAMNELFSALLDISKLDSGAMTPEIRKFPVAQLLERIESTFKGLARERGLSLRLVSSGAWVRSDFILLERILLNLVSNAVRYTTRGSILVGCRRRGEQLRIEIWDTGPGIPEDQRERVFGEFYRLDRPGEDRHGGLGLGLSIVERLCQLLDHRIELTSVVGRGTRFAVVVPWIAAPAEVASRPSPVAPVLDAADGKLVVVIDDDPLVLNGMSGLLQTWGYRVVSAGSDSAVLTSLDQYDQPPDLIISDYHLPDGKSGIEVIEHLRSAFSRPIPAFLISGDINPERLREARTSGYHLQHKPMEPMALRAMLNQLLKNGRAASMRQ
jgi:signal transduction histidine kinase